MAHLTESERLQMEHALQTILDALDPHAPVTNHVLAGVEEIRKVLDLDSDIPEWMHSERYTDAELALLAGRWNA